MGKGRKQSKINFNKQILNRNNSSLTKEDKRVLKLLIIKKVPENLRPKVLDRQ